MPDFNPTKQFSDNNQSTFTSRTTDNEQSSFATGVNTPPPVYQEENVRTYNDEEVNNPSVINVTIPDKSTPIMVLFGPPQSGKTMTMIRMAEYLSSPNRATPLPQSIHFVQVMTPIMPRIAVNSMG